MVKLDKLLSDRDQALYRAYKAMETKSKVYSIPLKFSLMSKPRGHLGRQGHIVHSTKEYLDYKKQVAKAVCGYIGDVEIRPPYGIILVHGFKIKAKNNDQDNLIGGIFDSLTDKGYLTDDSEKQLQFTMILSQEVKEETAKLFIWSLQDLHPLEVINDAFEYHEELRMQNCLDNYRCKYPWSNNG